MGSDLRDQRGEPLTGHDGQASAVAFGKLEDHPIALSAGDMRVRVWGFEGKTSPTVAIGSTVRALAFSPSYGMLVGARAGLMLIEFAQARTAA